jgi:hypothetical protein
MTRCKDCGARWPFAFALALAALVSFPAWATLNLILADPVLQLAGTALVFCIAGTGFVLYVRWCIRRNCTLRRAAQAFVAAPR